MLEKGSSKSFLLYSQQSCSSSDYSGDDCSNTKISIGTDDFEIDEVEMLKHNQTNERNINSRSTYELSQGSQKPTRKHGMIYMPQTLYSNLLIKSCTNYNNAAADEHEQTEIERNNKKDDLVFDPKFDHLPNWTPSEFLSQSAKQQQQRHKQSLNLLLDVRPQQIFSIGTPGKMSASPSSNSLLLTSNLSKSYDSTESLCSTPSYGVSAMAATANRRRATGLGNQLKNNNNGHNTTSKSVLFPSMRLLLAVLLGCCYITVSISSSNIAVALICMIKCPAHGYVDGLEWQSDQEGIILAAQNAGTLLILLIGYYADRINGKWMVGSSLLLCFVGNITFPLFAEKNFWYAVAGRLAIGASDACMSSAVNSLITRWFPHSERAAAIGIITSGRQIGTLFILPTAGYLCTRTDIQGGWPAIFYLSGLISGLVFLFWIPMGADKPAKQYCISRRECLFIESRIACESLGKRTMPRQVPWSDLLQSVPLWVSVFSLICHEYPLVIMLQFLPNYMRDVLQFTPTKNGILSALPILFLFVSKTLSASLSSWLSTRTHYNSTIICKVFNGIGSLGLSLSIFSVSQFRKEDAQLAIIALCCAMTFAGLHTPGVQTALLQIAPPFSGIITGISFFCVAWFSIGNKILTKWIVQHGDQEEWATVFYISTIVAILPVIVFSLWGTDERQWWAAPSAKTSTGSFAYSSGSRRSSKSSQTNAKTLSKH